MGKRARTLTHECSPRLREASWAALTAFAVLAATSACDDEGLTQTKARVRVTPLPEGNQEALSEPLGMELGPVPLNGLALARFRIDNPGTAPLVIDSAEVAQQSGGEFAVESFSREVPAQNGDEDAGELTVSFAPREDLLEGEATISIATNAGDEEDQLVTLIVRGIGVFVGNPTLEVCHGGECYVRDQECSEGVCTTAPLDFGNVNLETSATATVRLRNVPEDDTCQPPPGSPACTPVCRLVVSPDEDGENIGLGIQPGDAGFAIEGNVPLPFHLDVSNPQCDFVNEVPLAITFSAGAEESESSATLAIESNDPNAPLVRVPLIAAARQGPVAVAGFLPCDASHQPPNCTAEPESIRPLDRVFFDGRQSYDPSQPPRPITAYAWRVISWPAGANPDDFELEGSDQAIFSMWLPLAGEYVVRLEVKNDLGIESGVSDSSDVTFEAVPDSRLHFQLVWDHPSNDQDLHVTLASEQDLLCDSHYDCFWGNCKPQCPDAEGCRTDTYPPVWFAEDERSQGANPRLDLDDTNGLGPENINIDEPRPGIYRVYVNYYGLMTASDDPTNATVRIYADGSLRGEYRRRLQRYDVWRLAEIEWSDETGADVRTIASDGDGIGQVRSLQHCNQSVTFDSLPD